MDKKDWTIDNRSWRLLQHIVIIRGGPAQGSIVGKGINECRQDGLADFCDFCQGLLWFASCVCGTSEMGCWDPGWERRSLDTRAAPRTRSLRIWLVRFLMHSLTCRFPCQKKKRKEKKKEKKRTAVCAKYPGTCNRKQEKTGYGMFRRAFLG